MLQAITQRRSTLEFGQHLGDRLGITNALKLGHAGGVINNDSELSESRVPIQVKFVIFN